MQKVVLVREFQNIYDRNAIRIDNLGGIPVGYIARYQARGLALLMDRQLAQFAAEIPSESVGKWDLPYEVSFPSSFKVCYDVSSLLLSIVMHHVFFKSPSSILGHSSLESTRQLSDNFTPFFWSLWLVWIRECVQKSWWLRVKLARSTCAHPP